MFEMATPIQSPAKYEVRSVIWFLIAVYGDIMNSQNVMKCHEFSKERTDVRYDQRSSRPSLISDNLLRKIEGESHPKWHRMIREFHHIIPEVFKIAIHESVTLKLGYRKIVNILYIQTVNGQSQNQMRYA
jgi:hypothetical protein